LRQLALDRMKDFGADCRDVRYREVGVSRCPLIRTVRTQLTLPS
jgi:histone acetyltransferase (RNA polymerase elongator complex component)